KVKKPIWKDTFLVERGRLVRPVSFKEPDSREEEILKLCLKYGYPKPPCTPEKKIVCYSSGDQIYVQKCSVEVSETERCSCTRDGSRDDPSATSSCMCKKKPELRTEEDSENYGLKCFLMNKNYWKTPPYWTGPDFVACVNTANNTHWCLRTINSTHNFLYCKY
uniref:Uncharacterized protein n=1 Tax=Clytia hemisphaerica TaxID=252671 RepID=A0A7M5UVW7_9CNID